MREAFSFPGIRVGASAASDDGGGGWRGPFESNHMPETRALLAKAPTRASTLPAFAPHLSYRASCNYAYLEE